MDNCSRNTKVFIEAIKSNLMLNKTFYILSTFLGFLSLYFFYQFFLKWEFNSEGTAFDPTDGVTYSESSSIWGVVAFIFFLPMLFKTFLVIKKKYFKS